MKQLGTGQQVYEALLMGVDPPIETKAVVLVAISHLFDMPEAARLLHRTPIPDSTLADIAAGVVRALADDSEKAQAALDKWLQDTKRDALRPARRREDERRRRRRNRKRGR